MAERSDPVELSDEQIEALCGLLKDDRPVIAAALDRQISSLGEEDQSRALECLLPPGKGDS